MKSLSLLIRIFRCPLKTQMTSRPHQPPPSMRKTSLMQSKVPMWWSLSSQRSLMSMLRKQQQLNKNQSMRSLPLRKATRRIKTLISDTTQWACPWIRIPPTQMKTVFPKVAWSSMSSLYLTTILTRMTLSISSNIKMMRIFLMMISLRWSS